MINTHVYFENKRDVSSPENIDNAELIIEQFEDDNEDIFETKMDDYEQKMELNLNSNHSLGIKDIVEKKKTYDDLDKKNTMGKHDTARINEEEKVFSSIVDANVEYGEGGGNQYFIQNAPLLKEKDFLQKISEEKINYNEDNQSHSKKYSEKKIDGINILYDKRKINGDELKYLDENTSDNNAPENNTEERIEDVEEYNQLEKSTPSTESLTYVKGGENHEDYFHPLGNQEDSEGYEADSWKNAEDMNNGEIYYQILPEYKNESLKSKSSYFTDAETVDSCRNHDGEIDANKLFTKLQKKPNVEVDKSGNITTVSSYILIGYVYNRKNK